MTDIHLVATYSGAGVLNAAIDEFGLPGKVLCIGDALDLGPLSDRRERAVFWRSIATPGFGFPPDTCDDFFSPWWELSKSIAAEKPQRLLIWVSGNGADYVLLRLACHSTAKDLALWRVPVPPHDKFHAVAAHPPEVLAAFASRAVEIPRAEVTAMAQEYRRIAARPEPLRECDAQRRLLFKPITAHDTLILSCCPDEWTPAARVVGEAMGRADPRNPLSDMFAGSRLQHLIAMGLVDMNRSRRAARNYRVRRL